MSSKSLLILAILAVISGFIYTEGLSTYPFAEGPSSTTQPDRAFFDPDQDHFYDVGTN